MKLARQAGWTCLFGGVSLLPFALAFRWLASETAIVPVVGFSINVMFWFVIGITAISLFYGVWGLVCGYSPKAWSNYERQVNETIAILAEKEIRRCGHG